MMARPRWFVAGLFAGLLAGSHATAQSGGGYDLQWNAHAANGSAMHGASYALDATVGQPASAVVCGHGYVLRSGFAAGIAATDVIFRSGFDTGC